MNNTTHNRPTCLHIWQQNLNALRDAQIPLLNGLNTDEWDIIALQEPYINHINNTISMRRYHVVYP
ncbi:hypothetical protein PAXRUDRAFT_114572, partial [Paxillus rubicundulus Ve08.2h10]